MSTTVKIRNNGTEAKAFAGVPLMQPNDVVEVEQSRVEELLLDKDIKIVSESASDSNKKTAGGKMNETEQKSMKGVE